MTSLTLSVPDEMDTPKRLSVYGAVTVARTCAARGPGADGGDRDVHSRHARGGGGVTAEFAANCPSLCAVVSEGASPAVVGAPESAAARAPERAASEMSM